MHSKNRAPFSTEDLLKGFAESNKQVLEFIYKENYPNVRNYILKNNGMEADAKDIYQETILAAWLNIKEGRYTNRGEDSLGGYIFQIAKFKWLDKVKSKRHQSTVRLVTEDYNDALSEDPVTDEIQEMRIDYLNALYGKLDKKCRQLLNMFYYEKKSFMVIGKEMDFDPASVKTMKYRCMMKLKKMHTNHIE